MKLPVGGRHVFFDIVGEGRPLVVLHGWGARDGSYLRPWLDPLSRHRRLVYLDHSPDDGVLDELDALRGHLAHDAIDLFGHGHGGILAQRYALDRREHVATLILCGTLPLPSDGLALLSVPTLVLGGRADPWATPDLSKALFDLLPEADLVLFERSGHFPFVSQPETFHEVVGEWLADRSSAGADWSSPLAH